MWAGSRGCHSSSVWNAEGWGRAFWLVIGALGRLGPVKADTVCRRVPRRSNESPRVLNECLERSESTMVEQLMFWEKVTAVGLPGARCRAIHQ